VYNKSDILFLRNFLRKKFLSWTSNGTRVEEVWTSFKAVLRQGIEKYVPHKMPRINSDTEHYIREVKHLKVKLGRAYNRRTLDQY
jgi:hypothetical protein